MGRKPLVAPGFRRQPARCAFHDCQLDYREVLPAPSPKAGGPWQGDLHNTASPRRGRRAAGSRAPGRRVLNLRFCKGSRGRSQRNPPLHRG